jgi:hypothetical protein
VEPVEEVLCSDERWFEESDRRRFVPGLAAFHWFRSPPLGHAPGKDFNLVSRLGLKMHCLAGFNRMKVGVGWVHEASVGSARAPDQHTFAKLSAVFRNLVTATEADSPSRVCRIDS